MIALVVVAGITAVAGIWWLLRRRYTVVTVLGDSMSPTYRHGDRVLVRRTASVRRGDCVVFTDTRPGGWIVKRAVEITDDGRLLVLGDNPAGSYDSRHFGHIGTDRVRGVVLRRMGG